MTYKYTTADLVRARLMAEDPFTTNTSPTVNTVERWIQQVSERINQKTGRVWGETEYEEYVDYSGMERITLKHAPITEVISVEHDPYPLGASNAGTWDTKIEDTDYTVYKTQGQIVPLASWNPRDGLKRIRVTYKAGYEQTPLMVEELATDMVAIKVLDSLLFSKGNDVTTGGSISIGQVNIVDPSDYGVANYNRLRLNVDELMKDIAGQGYYRYQHA